MATTTYNTPLASSGDGAGGKALSVWVPNVGAVPVAGAATQNTDPSAANGGVTTGALLAQPAAVTVTQAAGTQAANSVLKVGAGYVKTILVTAAASAVLILYDNATTNSGTIVGYIKAAAVAGDIYSVDMPLANGLVARLANGSPSVTISIM